VAEKQKAGFRLGAKFLTFGLIITILLVAVNTFVSVSEISRVRNEAARRTSYHLGTYQKGSGKNTV